MHRQKEVTITIIFESMRSRKCRNLTIQHLKSKMVLSIFNNLGYPLIGSILLYHIHLADWRFQDIPIQQYEWRHWKDHHHYHQHYHPKLWWKMKANKAIIRNCQVKMKWTQSKKKLLQGSPILCFGLDAGIWWPVTISPRGHWPNHYLDCDSYNVWL